MEIVIIVFAIVCIVAFLLWQRNEKIRQQRIEEERLRELAKYQDEDYLKKLSVLDEFFALIENFEDYITWKKRDEIVEKFDGVGIFFKGKSDYYIKEPKVRKFNDLFQNFKQWIKKYNKNYVNTQKIKLEKYFNDIEGKKLDDQQRTAVVTDEYSNLIIAGAGSGKTLTILGKVKYLIEKKKVNPDKILLLSFTNKTVDELNNRLQKLNLRVEATTFHKLGYGLVKQFATKIPAVANENLLSNVIREFLKKDILTENSALNSFVRFMACYMVIPEEDDKFESLGEKTDINKGIDFETLKSKYEADNFSKKRVSSIEHDTFAGERVKSAEELAIANFLFLNGIKYEYEKPYPHDDYMYRPDFYLSDYDIWLEHFGVDKNGRAKWLSSFNEEKYITSMKLKREKHRQFNTKLLETYSYYNKDNVLLEKLQDMLTFEGVKFSPLSEKEIYEKIVARDDSFGTELHKLIFSFINLSKSRRMSLTYLQAIFQNRNSAPNEFMHSRQNLFLNFILPIIERYDKKLKETNEIDFNDMINLATDLITRNPSIKKYDYIIIDEYQDISVARFELIRRIREISDAKLVSVGDDWQSIYRFAGSDISLFSDYKKYVGEFEKLLIERTYRNSQQLIDASATFIQQNPKQIKKNPISQKTLENPIKYTTYTRNAELSALLEIIKQLAEKYGKKTSVLLLGRHSFDIDDILNQDTKNIIKQNKKTNKLEIKDFENVDIKFITVHKAKGLEADNVIILNVKNDLYGFPNKLTDDPILSLLLSKGEEFRFAEERRLFYVALTRTKNEVHLLIPENESLFAEEIVKYAGYLISNVNGELKLSKCPWCKTGKLVMRKNNNIGNEFLGCSHYPNCNQTYKNVEILRKPILCPSCQSGFLVKRNGRFGEFLGCTNYPDCKQTLQLEQ
jgi:DNA helicase-4